MRTTVILPDLFPVEVIVRAEILDFTGKLGLKFRRIKPGDRSRATYAIDQGIPIFGNGIPDRCKRSKTSYYNSP
jgi:hypothetical protein